MSSYLSFSENCQQVKVNIFNLKFNFQMPCDFSKLWPTIIEASKCDGSLEMFETLSENIRPSLEKLKSVNLKGDDNPIDLKELIANRISPYSNVHHLLGRLNICKYHLVGKILALNYSLY